MLSASDFNLPIDREFTLVKIRQEIDECDNKEALRENLKMLVEQNARFQHMIGKLLEQELMREVEGFADFIKEHPNGLRGKGEEI